MNNSKLKNWMPPAGARVAVALSGGVDSALAAALLVEAGCRVAAVTLKLWCNEDFPELETEKSCCSRESIDDAAAVAGRLGIAHHVWDFSDQFMREVIDPFRREYRGGRTPNPCVDCNRNVRFRTLHEKLKQAGFGTIATGHYARIVEGTVGGRMLLKGRDDAKDQSYVLWGISAESLAGTTFPLGDLTKGEVRRLSAERKLPVAEKEESQDICFVPGHDVGAFLGLLEGGDILDSKGKKVGEHNGAARYTVGQRRGLGVSSESPLYVTAVDVVNNIIRVGRDEELLADGAVAGQVNLLVPPGELEADDHLTVKIRYRHAGADATVLLEGDGRLLIRFREQQRAITPGQSAVIYRGEQLLGGGVIDTAF